MTQAGQEHFIKSLSLPLASGDLWGAAVRDVATAELQVSSPSHPGVTLRVPGWRSGDRDCVPLSIHSLMFPVSLSRNNLTSGKRN